MDWVTFALKWVLIKGLDMIITFRAYFRTVCDNVVNNFDYAVL